MRKLAALLVLVLAGLVPATASAAPLALVASTSRVAYFAEPGSKVDVKKSEQFLTRLEERFGTTVSGARFVRYRSPERLVAATGFYAAGVTLPQSQEVHSTQAYHPHELVHLVVSTLGDPGLVFQEGLAVVVGDEGRVEGKRVDDVTLGEVRGRTFAEVSDLFRLGGAGASEYRLAGGFVSYLQRRAGADAVVRLFRECRRATQAPQAFAAVFGTSIEGAWADWQRELAQSRT